LVKRYLIFVVIFINLFSCSKSSEIYKIDQVVLQSSTKRFDKDFSKEIEGTKTFAENFINSYLALIRKEIDPVFLDSFVLGNSKNFRVQAFFSSVSESFMSIEPAKNNELVIECTRYPIQMGIFAGLDLTEPPIRLMSSYDEALNQYRESSVMIETPLNGHMAIGRLTLSNTNPKWFGLRQNTLVILYQMSLQLRYNDESDTLDTRIEHLGLLTGEVDFDFAIEKAKNIGRWLAESKIQSLFISSSFFREALAHKNLGPIAKVILENQSHVEKDPKFGYPFWKFQMDIESLRKEAQKFGLDVSYVDRLFKDPTIKPQDGYLFWYYKNHVWFMLQWILINFAILAILLIERLRFKRKKIKIFEGISKSAVIITVNGWIFHSRPDYIHFKYWVLPGLFFLICIFLTFKYKEDQK